MSEPPPLGFSSNSMKSEIDPHEELVSSTQPPGADEVVLEEQILEVEEDEQIVIADLEDLSGVAGQVIVDDSAYMTSSASASSSRLPTRKVISEQRPIPQRNRSVESSLVHSQVLLTEEALKGNPKVYVHRGRPANLSKSKYSSTDMDLSADHPPTLDLGSGRLNKTNVDMQAFFRVYADSALKKADQFSFKDERRAGGASGGGGGGGEGMGGEQKMAHTGGEADDVDEGEDQPAQMEQPGINRMQLSFSFGGWPLYWDRPVDFQEACELLTGTRQVLDDKICMTVPQNFRDEGTFVVDLSGLSNRHDVSLDGMGQWGKPTGRTRFYAQRAEDRVVRVDDSKGKLIEGESYEWKCMCKRYDHPASLRAGGRFIRRIYTAVHPPEKQTIVSLAVVTYEWVGDPIDFEVNNEARGRRAEAVPPDGSRSWEAASLQGHGQDVLPSTCSAYFLDSPLYAVGAVDFATAACIILGGTHIDISKICCRVPQGYRDSGSFVIDVRNFVSDAELRRDGNGIWGKPAGHSRYYKIDPVSGDAVRVDRAHKLLPGTDYDIQILAKRYEHRAVDGRFVRKIYTGRSPTGDRYYHTCSHLAVITYYWKGEAEWFDAGGPQRKVRQMNILPDGVIRRQLLGEEEEEEEVEEERGMRGGGGGGGIVDGGHAGMQTLPHPAHHSQEEEIVVEEVADDDLHEYVDEEGMAAGGRGGVPVPGPSHRPSAPSEPSRKRMRPSTSALPPTLNNIQHMSDAELESVRALVYKKEFENQERLAAILDRADAFLTRMERVAEAAEQWPRGEGEIIVAEEQNFNQQQFMM